VKIQVFRDVTRSPLLNVYRRFDSQSPVVLECLTLQLSRHITSKSCWLPTSWLNDLRSQKIRFHTPIAVITLNVATKPCCLLQVSVAKLLLVSCDAFVKRYPVPLANTKYYLRIDDSFYNLTCPKSLVFDQYKQQCTLNNYKFPEITPLNANDCNKNKEGYYCNSAISFIYCTHDNTEIIKNASCPSDGICLGIPSPCPCGSDIHLAHNTRYV